MVDQRSIWIRRVRVDTLTLYIIEIKLSIIILGRNGESFSFCCAFFSIEGFQALPIVIIQETDIINIVMEFRVLLNALMKSLEWII